MPQQEPRGSGTQRTTKAGGADADAAPAKARSAPRAKKAQAGAKGATEGAKKAQASAKGAAEGAKQAGTGSASAKGAAAKGAATKGTATKGAATKGAAAKGRSDKGSAPDAGAAGPPRVSIHLHADAAQIDAIAERLRKRNERIIALGREAGGETLQSYEKALSTIASAISPKAAKDDLDWLTQLAASQAKLVRDVTETLVKAARERLK